MELVLPVTGAFFALLYVLLALFRTLRRTPDIRWTELLLAFLTALVPLAGLIYGGLDGIPNSQLELGTLGLAAALLVIGLLLIIIELFRPQRLKQSRGILTLGIGVMLAFAAVLVPLAGAYFSLPPVDQDAGQTAAVVQPGEPTPDDSSQFYTVFAQVIQIVADAANLSFDEVLTRLDNGETVAGMVAASNGNIEQVIDDITGIMQDFLRALVEQDRVNRLQASAGIAGMEIVVRYAVNNDLSTLQRTGQEQAGITPDPSAVSATPGGSFFAFLTVTVTPAGDSTGTPVASALAPSSIPTLTPPPSITPPPTAQPSLTRTPRPTQTASSTRARYATRTPTLTPTLPSPCLAVMNFNVNLRDRPELDAALVTTIPYETTVNVFGRNEDTTWWFVEYNGQAGWISAEFVSATSSCSQLPVRPVPRN